MYTPVQQRQQQWQQRQQQQQHEAHAQSERVNPTLLEHFTSNYRAANPAEGTYDAATAAFSKVVMNMTVSVPDDATFAEIDVAILTAVEKTAQLAATNATLNAAAATSTSTASASAVDHRRNIPINATSAAAAAAAFCTAVVNVAQIEEADATLYDADARLSAAAAAAACVVLHDIRSNAMAVEAGAYTRPLFSSTWDVSDTNHTLNTPF
jgi:hypothetical protein